VLSKSAARSGNEAGPETAKAWQAGEYIACRHQW
jgi:hypothetical protein